MILTPEVRSTILVVAAGMRRSGSTWLFNVLRFAYINAGYRTYSDYEDQYNRSISAAAHVLKIHPFKPAVQQRADYIFTACRDVRDIMASMVRRDLIANRPEALASGVAELITQEYRPWQPHSHLEVRYETMIQDRVGTIAAILKVVQLTHVDPEEVARDVDKLGLVVLPGRDRATQLWPGHVTDGRARGYQDTLSADGIAAIEGVAGDWLRGHGYPVPGLLGQH